MDANPSQEKLSRSEWWLVLLFGIAQPIIALIVLYFIWHESQPGKWASARKIIVTVLFILLGILVLAALLPILFAKH